MDVLKIKRGPAERIFADASTVLQTSVREPPRHFATAGRHNAASERDRHIDTPATRPTEAPATPPQYALRAKGLDEG